MKLSHAPLFLLVLFPLVGLALPACSDDADEPLADGGSSSGGSSSSSGGSSSSSGGTSSSSSSGTVGDGGTLPVFALSPCDGDTYAPLTGLSLPTSDEQVPVDYIEYRRDYSAFGSDAGNDNRLVLGTYGTICVGAEDVAACTATVQTTSVEHGFEADPSAQALVGLLPPSVDYLVVTRGSSVSTVSTLAELTELLGGITTAKDAVLEAAVRRYQITCGGDHPSTLQQNQGGWNVTALSGTTCGEGTELDGHVLDVTNDATFTVVSTVKLADGIPGCAF